MSLSSLPQIWSFPPSPSILSLPPRATITSLPSVPVRSSGSGVPTIVAGSPSHVATVLAKLRDAVASHTVVEDSRTAAATNITAVIPRKLKVVGGG